MARNKEITLDRVSKKESTLADFADIIARTPRQLKPSTHADAMIHRVRELELIIIDLFAPDKHFDGCLSRERGMATRLPCQCGYSGRMNRYQDALAAAKALAKNHDYIKWSDTDEAIRDVRSSMTTRHSPGGET
jgi:hypothetical protein